MKLSLIRLLEDKTGRETYELSLIRPIEDKPGLGTYENVFNKLS